VVELARERARLDEMGAAAARFGRHDGDEALRAFMLEVLAGSVGRHRRSA
jgi:UDP-N-acetylglucosamine--N-acetylmuramyl-(pentapeptide) pyrophosphoryl-undecaprenol N-acetylglucosamine transferase